MLRMAIYVHCLALLLSCFLQITRGQRYYRPGRRVCSDTRRTTEIVPMNQTYIRPFYNKCTTNCTGPRIIYKMTYRTVFYRRLVHDVVRHCCPGWRKENQRDSSCRVPICKSKCENGGRCIGPDQCLCPKNFTGINCEKDINECSLGTHQCQQLCNNTHGGYTCSCFDGFVLTGKYKCQFCPVCLPAFEEMLNKVNDLQNRIVTVENEKEQLLQNISMMENRYTDAMHKVDELKEVTIRTFTMASPTTKPPPVPSYPNQDIVSSLSNQISLLEERIGSCDCGYGSRRYDRRRYRERG